MKKLSVLIYAMAVTAWLGILPAKAEPPFSLAGEITVTKVSDGDSLRSGRLKIRLFGIDAPELKQDCADPEGRRWACGKAARDRLAELATAPLQCELVDVDRYARLVMRCLSAGTDVAEALVAQGLALAYFDERPTGSLVTRLTTDVKNVSELLTSSLVVLAFDAPARSSIVRLK